MSKTFSGFVNRLSFPAGTRFLKNTVVAGVNGAAIFTCDVVLTTEMRGIIKTVGEIELICDGLPVNTKHYGRESSDCSSVPLPETLWKYCFLNRQTIRGTQVLVAAEDPTVIFMTSAQVKTANVKKLKFITRSSGQVSYFAGREDDFVRAFTSAHVKRLNYKYVKDFIDASLSGWVLFTSKDFYVQHSNGLYRLRKTKSCQWSNIYYFKNRFENCRYTVTPVNAIDGTNIRRINCLNCEVVISKVSEIELVNVKKTVIRHNGHIITVTDKKSCFVDLDNGLIIDR